MREQQGFAKEQPDNQPNSLGSQGSGIKLNNPTFTPLQRVGNYDLVRRIDIGGMGEVYLARQRTAFGREVAVKIIRSDLINDMTVRKRFLREAEVTAFLKHNHILPVVEVGEENGRLFLVTPYIKGGNLSKRLRNGALSLSETRELFTSLVHAVAYLHKNSVVHRDLKPSNILLDHEEGSERAYVRLIDFGIASLQGQIANAPLTTAGHEMGTEAYMAPERLNGIAAPCNDIYSLGIILYQMLTGKLPENEVDAMLPDPLAEVVQRSTESDLRQRYANAEELLKAFEFAYQSLSLSHFRVSGSSPEHPPIGWNVSVGPSARPPLATPPPQVPLSAPATPPLNERTFRPPVTPPPVNRQSGTFPDANNATPAPNSLNSTNGQNMGLRSDAQASHLAPISNGDVVQIDPTGFQDENVMGPGPYSSQPSSLARSRSEVVLPPLPSKSGPFAERDYEAPTSYLNPQNLQRTGATAEHTTDVGSKKALPRPQQKRRGLSVVTIISAIIAVIIIVIGSIGYAIYQSLDTATITVVPRVQSVSVVLNLTAKLHQTDVDANAGTIPADVLTSSPKSASKSGNTTSPDPIACVFNPNCKQTVSVADVETLTAQLQPGVRSQVDQDLAQKAQAQHETPVGKTVYNETSTASPQIGTVSKTVQVTFTSQGSQEFIKASNVTPIAKQKLQGKLQPNYMFVNNGKDIQIGQPKVQGVDAQGNVQFQIAAGANSIYNVTASDKTAMQNQIAGKSQNDARTFVARNPNLDPDNISIHINLGGGNLPGNADHITINVSNPATMPSVQLPTI